MKNKKMAWAAFAIFLPFGAFAMGETICTMNNVERRVEVASTNTTMAVPCKVQYFKEDGSTKILWNAQNDIAYCEAKAREFVQKLETLGWACTEGSAKTSTPATTESPTTTQSTK